MTSRALNRARNFPAKSPPTTTEAACSRKKRLHKLYAGVLYYMTYNTAPVGTISQPLDPPPHPTPHPLYLKPPTAIRIENNGKYGNFIKARTFVHYGPMREQEQREVSLRGGDHCDQACGNHQGLHSQCALSYVQ